MKLKNDILNNPGKAKDLAIALSETKGKLRDQVYAFCQQYQLLLFSYGLYNTKQAVAAASDLGKYMISHIEDALTDVGEIVSDRATADSATRDTLQLNKAMKDVEESPAVKKIGKKGKRTHSD